MANKLLGGVGDPFIGLIMLKSNIKFCNIWVCLPFEMQSIIHLLRVREVGRRFRYKGCSPSHETPSHVVNYRSLLFACEFKDILSPTFCDLKMVISISTTNLQKRCYLWGKRESRNRPKKKRIIIENTPSLSCLSLIGRWFITPLLQDDSLHYAYVT